jgi:DNA repair protein RadC
LCNKRKSTISYKRQDANYSADQVRIENSYRRRKQGKQTANYKYRGAMNIFDAYGTYTAKDYAISTNELLALLIGGQKGSIVARDLLHYYENDLRGIYNAKVNELTEFSGIGEVTALRIKAGLSIGLQLAISEKPIKACLKSPSDCAQLVMPEMSLLEAEELWVALLDIRLNLIKIDKIYRGGVSSATIYTRDIIKPAIKLNAASIVMYHNHPSGNPDPSPNDISVTHVIHKSCELLDINLIDHIIIGRNSFVSLKERGVSF